MSYAGAAYATALYGGPEAAAPTAGTYPAVTVEIAFTSSPKSESPAWVDVTPDLRSGETSRGRQRELARYGAGTAMVVLNNRDRDYDPTYTSSPYNGYLVPGRRMRIRAQYGGVTYPLFDGTVDGWGQQYTNPSDGTCVLRATDGFKALARQTFEKSPYEAQVMLAAPAAWWHFDEAVGTQFAYDRLDSGVHALNLVTPPVTFGTAPLPARSTGTSVTFTQGTGGVLRGVGGVLTGGPFTVELLHTWNNTSVDETFIWAQVKTDRTRGFWLTVDTAGLLRGQIREAGVTSTVSASLTVNIPTHIVWVWQTSGDQQLYLNGVLRDNGYRDPAVTFPHDAGWVYGIGSLLPSIGSDPGVYSPGGVIDELAIYNTTMSATTVARHHTAFTTAWSGDLPGTRAGRLLDAFGWPTNLRELDTGASILQATALGSSVLNEHQAVADAEFGALFMARNGDVRLIARSALRGKAVLATFGENELPYSDITLDQPEEQIRNDVTIARAGGAPQFVRDQASIADYGTHTFSQTGLTHTSDTVSYGAAAAIVAQYKNPLLRVTSLTVQPRRRPADLFPAVLSLELTDLVTVKRRPQNVGAPISQNSVIESINHSFNATDKGWTTRFELSPSVADLATAY